MRGHVEIHRRDGTSEKHSIAGSEVLLGRSANVAISLPNEQELDLEHLMILPRGAKGCWVSAAERVTTPVMLHGKEFHSGMVRWGTEFKIGSLTIKLVVDEAKRSPLSQVHPGLLAAAVVGVGFLLWSFTKEPPTQQIDSGRQRSYPQLFSEAPGCPANGESIANAERAEHIAHSKGDRYLYDPRDGVSAVLRFREAAACYGNAERVTEASRMEAAADTLAARVDADYAAARLNLANTIDQKLWADASRETRRLLLLTDHLGEHEYVEWLKKINRQVSAKAAEGS